MMSNFLFGCENNSDELIKKHYWIYPFLNIVAYKINHDVTKYIIEKNKWMFRYMPSHHMTDKIREMVLIEYPHLISRLDTIRNIPVTVTEPNWSHNFTMKQAIGRAYRKCSHITPSQNKKISVTILED